VPYQLARFFFSTGETHALDNIVEPSFQELQKVVARDAFHPLGLFEITTELSFENAIDTLDLLFFPELQAILGMFNPRLTMLPGGVTSPRDTAFICITTLSLQKELRTFPSAEFTN
jgi:hypothetical protein